MAIQNNINAMLGTVAGAAAMGKHLNQQAEANDLAEKNAAINAAEKISETIDTAQELGTSYKEYEKKQDSLIKDVEKYDKQFDDLVKNASPESILTAEIEGPEAGEKVLEKQKANVMDKRMQAYSDVQMMQKAKEELELKWDAKRLQAEIYRDQINRVGKKGKDMGTVKLPWEKEKQ